MWLSFNWHSCLHNRQIPICLLAMETPPSKLFTLILYQIVVCHLYILLQLNWTIIFFMRYWNKGTSCRQAFLFFYNIGRLHQFVLYKNTFHHCVHPLSQKCGADTGTFVYSMILIYFTVLFQQNSLIILTTFSSLTRSVFLPPSQMLSRLSQCIHR